MDQYGIASFSGKVSHWRMVLRSIRDLQRMARTTRATKQSKYAASRSKQPTPTWRSY